MARKVYTSLIPLIADATEEVRNAVEEAAPEIFEKLKEDIQEIYYDSYTPLPKTRPKQWTYERTNALKEEIPQDDGVTYLGNGAVTVNHLDLGYQYGTGTSPYNVSNMVLASAHKGRHGWKVVARAYFWATYVRHAKQIMNEKISALF